MLKFKIHTFGCKANKYDSALIENILSSSTTMKSARKDENSDFIIVNTCTVTGSTDSQVRQLLRKLRRENPESKLFVSGCYARLDGDSLKENGLADEIFTNLSEEGVAQEIKLALGISGSDLAQKSKNYLTKFSGQTRAFLKVQDGCESFCSYCIIPFVRGKSRSKEPSDVLEQIKIYGQKGYKEVVLTGIHLGIYGRDLNQSADLLSLLKLLENESPVRRIRLSSLEPDELSEEMIEFLAESEVVNHHLHLPVQSGDDHVLKMMGRRYTRKYFIDKVGQLKKTIPFCGLGTDLIVGFPGETEEGFTNTLELINMLPLTYIHVFPFSVRKGTRAEGLGNRIDPRIIKKRSAILLRAGKEKKCEFRNSLKERIESVLIEGKPEKKTGLPKGFSRNYVPVIIESSNKKNVTHLIDKLIFTYYGRTTLEYLVSPNL